MMQISPLYPCNPRFCLSACLCLLFTLLPSRALCSLLSFHSSFQQRCHVLVYSHDKTNLAPSSKDVGNFIRSGVLFVCVYVCVFVYFVATVLVGFLVGIWVLLVRGCGSKLELMYGSQMLHYWPLHLTPRLDFFSTMLLRWARITFSINHTGHICRKKIQLKIMLSKRGQIQKDRYHIFYYIWRTHAKVLYILYM